VIRALAADELHAADVDGALRSGGFLLEGAVEPELAAAVLGAAHHLFALPRAVKEAVGIERSPQFRGWSELHNERDWREQLHVGRDRPVSYGPDYRRLEGPNLWPEDAGWRRTINRYLEGVSRLGDEILARAAAALGFPEDPRLRSGQDGYALMKLIGYHPQASPAAARPGVAAHVDFSWLTLTMQDSPGLEICTPGGLWETVEVRPRALWVHPGELLQLATRGRYRATPHRVLNRSTERTRVSIPFFLDPPLAAVVPVLDLPLEADDFQQAAHVHRVLDPRTAPAPLHFGEAEWRRKGLDGWCFACARAG
jgi:isopenicillin N synthase-like dioxygenase